MVRTTKEQRRALRKLHMRAIHDSVSYALDYNNCYRRFRAAVQPLYGCDGAIAVKWCGMWLCIEPDGYSHS